MKQIVIRIFSLLLAVFVLAGCQVTSPITTTKDFLTQLQNKSWEQAADFVVLSNNAQIRSLTEEEKQTWITTTQEDLGVVTNFTVQNAIPLQEPALNKLGSNEGYEVFFELEAAKLGSQHLKTVLVKVDNSWKLLDPDLSP